MTIMQYEDTLKSLAVVEYWAKIYNWKMEKEICKFRNKIMMINFAGGLHVLNCIQLTWKLKSPLSKIER